MELTAAVGLLGVAPWTHAITLHVGLTNGASAAYRLVGADWRRIAEADIPAVDSHAFPARADLDGDGDADAMLGQQDGMVVGLANVGSDAAPAWARMPAWDVGRFGGRSAPALSDLDGDGDVDLLVGSRGGTLVGVENVGSAAAPAWQPAPAWDVGGVGKDAHPALGDLDGDGAPDLLVGTTGGPILAFAGTGRADAPFARFPGWDPPTVGTRTTPGLGDLDGDGRVDLLVADGRAIMHAFRNVGGGWIAAASWVPDDPGSGPVGLALVGVGSAVAPPAPPAGNRSPTVRLAVAPATGAAPLAVHLDASGSSDPDGDVLVYRWDFGDGTAAATADPAVLEEMDARHAAARAARDADRFAEARALYDAAVADLLPLVALTGDGPVTRQGTARVDRVARWYLQKIAHDMGAMYLWNDLGLPACERHVRALQLSREAVAQAVAGGFPALPGLNGTETNVAEALARLAADGCAVPAYAPQLGQPAAAAGPVVEHVYRRDGTYRVTVAASDGGRSASAAATVVVGASPPPPPPADGGEPLEGFGAGTPGGAGGRVLRVTEASDAAVRAAFAEAAGGHAVVRFDVREPIEIVEPLPRLVGPYVTIAGNGATLYAPRIGRSAAIVDVRGHDVIVRDLRLRNGGDNLRAQGRGAYNVVFSHVSSTGAADDGISIGYGAHDVTVQYCFLAGNTRGIFLKYGDTTNVSIHHSWVMKYWIRGPLVSQAVMSDVRNVIVEDWMQWGVRFERQASGNVVESSFRLSPYADAAGGKADSALRFNRSDAVYTAGNVFRGVAERGDVGSASAPFPAPPVTTLPVAAMEDVVEHRAGCMPRDAVDQQYIATTSGWRVGESRPFRLGPGS